MYWLTCNLDKQTLIKEYGSLSNLRKQIKKDLPILFENYKFKDKNTDKIIVLTSSCWDGLLDKISVFKLLIKDLHPIIYNDFITESKEPSVDVAYMDDYFNSDTSKIIYALVELDGSKRAEILNISRKCYSNKKSAKTWRDSLAKKIHPDISKHPKSTIAISKLNQLYEEMISIG